MRDLYEQVLSDPCDAPAWRALALGFARRGRVARAVACLDALEACPDALETSGDALEGSGVAGTPAEAGELRRAARRESVARHGALRAALAGPDGARVSVIVSGRAGELATERTLASLAAQSLEPQTCQVLVATDRAGALGRARGRYVACVQAGDELWPDHLAMLADHLDRSGRAMTWSQALRPGPEVTDASPLLPRQAARAEVAPDSCVLVRRRDLLALGGFDPALGRGQSWHVWRQLVDRLAADAVPVLSARVAGDDVSPRRRFDLLLVRRGTLARAHRRHRRARRHLARGDVALAAAELGRAWNLGLEPAPYVATLARVAEHSPSLAADLAALGAAEVEPLVRGAFRRIARGAEARRILAVRSHRHALRLRYEEADRRGRERAGSLGWTAAGC